MKTSN